MLNKIRGRFALSVAAVVVTAGVAFAAINQENYTQIKRPSGAAADFPADLLNLAGGDSTTWDPTTALVHRRYFTYADPLVSVVCRMSAPGATACVELGVRNSSGKFVGVAGIQTATAGSGATVVYDGTGYYAPEPLVFHVSGWSYYEIRCTDVSGSSTVDLLPTTVGAKGAAAEE